MGIDPERGDAMRARPDFWMRIGPRQPFLCGDQVIELTNEPHGWTLITHAKG